MIHELIHAGEPATIRGRQAARPEHSLDNGELSPDVRDAAGVAMLCAESTLGELAEEGYLSAAKRRDVMTDYAAQVRERSEEEPIPDVLFFLAQREVGSDAEESVFDETDKLVTLLLRSNRRRKVVRCPFLHLTRTPSIYREIPAVMQFCRILMVPVVQAHEKELITLAPINPVVGGMAMDIVSQLVEEAAGRRPIPAMAIATAAHWRQLNRKHFGS